RSIAAWIGAATAKTMSATKAGKTSASYWFHLALRRACRAGWLSSKLIVSVLVMWLFRDAFLPLLRLRPAADGHIDTGQCAAPLKLRLRNSRNSLVAEEISRFVFQARPMSMLGMSAATGRSSMRWPSSDHGRETLSGGIVEALPAATMPRSASAEEVRINGSRAKPVGFQ